MRIGAVICEFNPFHFGHEYIISEAKKHCDAVIAVMSGAFTQRGETAIMSKYERARMAIDDGCNLVLELPFPFSAAGAEKFAAGGVGVINKLGCVDEIIFGSECADCAEIKKTAENLLSDKFKAALNDAKGNNQSARYADMYFDIYRKKFGNTPVFDGSNDILAVNYAAELIKANSNIELRPVKRIGCEYNGGGTGYASASEIRTLILNGVQYRDKVPEYVYNIISENSDKIYRYDGLFTAFASYFRLHGTADFSSAFDMTDELSHRIKTAFEKSTDLNNSINMASSKNYSHSRVRRAMLNAVLELKNDDYGGVLYTSLLAADKTGREILSQIRKTSQLPIITKPSDYKSFGDDVLRAYGLSLKADALASLCRVSPCQPNEMLKQGPYIK